MPVEIEIRPVRASEYTAAGEATALAYQEFAPSRSPGWQAYIARIADVAARADRTTVLVVLADGIIAGSATLELDQRMNASAEPLAAGEAHLRMLGVHPDYRGRGIGRALVIASLDLARAQGKHRLTLDTSPVMLAAQRMYAAMGFTATGAHRTPDGVDLLGYRRDIVSEPSTTR
jgi:ribosomal protein S18 acetylase RimI-like enzyme